ncbi:MAG: hypothetical protein IJI57_12250 [Flexilinea sp.]|nr:hypothetical protein [Flexilinea sp.]
MTQNILLTTLGRLGNDRPLHYYSVKNKFGYNYCEALQSMEASSKYILASYPIDEILVIGDEVNPGNEGKSLRLKDAGDLYSSEPRSLSAFDLYRSRIAQYIDEISLEQQGYEKLLSEEMRTRLSDFILKFLEKYSKQETKRLNRFFDEMAGDRQLYDQFKDALFAAYPDLRKDSRLVMKWIKNDLYTQLKPSFKLEILPINEKISVRYVPAAMMDNREYWFNDILNVDQDVLDGKNEINIFVSLDNDSSVDSHLILNILDILISAPGSNVHLKKIYRVMEPSGNLTGKISDNTYSSLSTDLVTAAHAFLNYGKTDMLVNFWENSGEQNERISSLIYAARHVDVGMSMCNILEVGEGLQRLRSLLKDKRSWTETGNYGLLFGVIAGCIESDYSTLLESSVDDLFIELIKWAYRHQLYQQVLTLIESHAPTILVRSGIFYYCDDESQAPRVTELLARQRLELKPYEYYKMDDIEHYFVKNYDRAGVRYNDKKIEDRNLAYAMLRAQSINNQDASKISAHTACSDIETVQKVLYGYYHLGSVRNKISHADAKAMADRRLIVSENDVSYAMSLMKESIEYFIINFEKAMEEIRNKKPKVVFISADDVRNAADRIKHERYQDNRNRTGRYGNR